MDNFTLSVLIGDVALMAFFLLLIVIDKPRRQPEGPSGSAKLAGKRSA